MGCESRFERAASIASSSAEHVEPEGIQALRASDGCGRGRSCETCRAVSVWLRCSGNLRVGRALLLASTMRDSGESGSNDTVRVEEVASERVELEGAQTLHACERRDGLCGRGGCNHGRWLGWVGCLMGDGGGSELRAEGLGLELERVFMQRLVASSLRLEVEETDMIDHLHVVHCTDSQARALMRELDVSLPRLSLLKWPQET
ncbi:hypothetical protein EXIGLDRAFT_824540, partial [Exidia glandulosa HHB12029]